METGRLSTQIQLKKIINKKTCSNKMKNNHNHLKVLFFYFSHIVSLEHNYRREQKFPFEGWMSAIHADFVVNLGNRSEHDFTPSLIPSLIDVVPWAEHRDHLTNCVVKDIPRVFIWLWFPKVSKVSTQVFFKCRHCRGLL